jgi:hypothetical protein
MTLLSVIQDTCERLSLVVPDAVETSTDRQVRQLAALLNQQGKDMVDSYAWQVLVTEQTFVTTATPEQVGSVPADWDRFIPNSFFNRTTRRGVYGPITPQRWQAIQAQPIFNMVYLSFRQRTGEFLMVPTPPAGQTIAYEYVSKNWAQRADGTPINRMVRDDDFSLLDEEVLTLSIMWRFLRGKGLDYAEEMATYERALETLSARDGAATVLSTTPRPVDPSRINLPDGDFPYI